MCVQIGVRHKAKQIFFQHHISKSKCKCLTHIPPKKKYVYLIPTSTIHQILLLYGIFVKLCYNKTTPHKYTPKQTTATTKISLLLQSEAPFKSLTVANHHHEKKTSVVAESSFQIEKRFFFLNSSLNFMYWLYNFLSASIYVTIFVN